MNRIKKEDGFTMVEVLMSLAILVIIIFGLVNIFNTGAKGIFGAGRKSEALFKGQEEMDNSIAEGLSNTYTEGTHEIIFNLITITPKGEEKEILYEYEGRTGTLKYFLPSGN